MSYEHPGSRGLDYQPYNYGSARLVLRGPQKPLRDPFTAFLGGTETFGKFVARPFPELVERHTGLTSVNLGSVHAGPEAFLSEPDLLDLANSAEAVVVQIFSAHNLSNQFYSVHPRRNDRFVRAKPQLQLLYPDTDFTDFAFTGHLLSGLLEQSPKAFGLVVAELRATWVARMTELLQAIEVPKILLWIGENGPSTADSGLPSIRQPGGPLFVDGDMVAEVCAYADRYVEVVLSSGARASGTRGMAFSTLEAMAAAALPGPRAHEEVAEALAPPLLRATGRTHH